jgi:hypothetical protein
MVTVLHDWCNGELLMITLIRLGMHCDYHRAMQQAYTRHTLSRSTATTRQLNHGLGLWPRASLLGAWPITSATHVKLPEIVAECCCAACALLCTAGHPPALRIAPVARPLNSKPQQPRRSSTTLHAALQHAPAALTSRGRPCYWRGEGEGERRPGGGPGLPSMRWSLLHCRRCGNQ